MTSITQDDLLAALAEAIRPVEGPTDAKTMDEMMLTSGWGQDKLRRALKLAKQQGRLEVVQVVRESLAGATIRVPAYRLKP